MATPITDKGITFQIITDASDEKLGQAYSLLEKSFPANELDSLEGIKRLLDKNTGVNKGKNNLYGVVYATDNTGTVVGVSSLVLLLGMQPGKFTIQGENLALTGKTNEDGSILPLITRHRETLIIESLKEKGYQGEEVSITHVFSEREDLFTQTGRQFAQAKTDPVFRNRRMETEFPELYMPYIQPALHEGAQELPLSFAVKAKGENGESTIDPNIIKTHLNNYFSASFDEKNINSPTIQTMLNTIGDKPVSILPTGLYDNVKNDMLKEVKDKIPQEKIASLNELYFRKENSEDAKEQKDIAKTISSEEFKAIQAYITTLPPAEQAKPIGELFPQTAQKFRNNVADITKVKEPEVTAPTQGSWKQRINNSEPTNNLPPR